MKRRKLGASTRHYNVWPRSSVIGLHSNCRDECERLGACRLLSSVRSLSLCKSPSTRPCRDRARQKGSKLCNHLVKSVDIKPAIVPCHVIGRFPADACVVSAILAELAHALDKLRVVAAGPSFAIQTLIVTDPQRYVPSLVILPPV